jgi:hypothetical protein
MENGRPVKLDYASKSPKDLATRIRQIRGAMCGARARRIRRRTLYGLVFVVCIGYLSDLFSTRAVEDDAARALFEGRHGFGEVPEQFWVQSSESDAIFRRVGIFSSWRNPYGPPWQRLEVERAKIHWPYLCSVHGVVGQGQYEFNGDTYYLCLFGRVRGFHREPIRILVTH